MMWNHDDGNSKPGMTPGALLAAGVIWVVTLVLIVAGVWRI